MLYFLISTDSCSASTFAFGVGRTLNPIIIAFESAEAKVTSLSLIAPADEWITTRRISFVESFSRAVLSASAEPCKSALIITLNSLISF